MLNLFGRKSPEYRQLKALFIGWESFLLRNKDKVGLLSEAAVECSTVVFSPIADLYNIRTAYDSKRLLATISPEKLQSISAECLSSAHKYMELGLEHRRHGANLAGVYFGVAALIVKNERSAMGLWKQVDKAMSMSVDVAYHFRKSAPSPKEPSAAKPSKDIHQGATTTSGSKYSEVARRHEQELASLKSELKELYDEQLNLFRIVEKRSEQISPAKIYGAAVSVMSQFERVLSRKNFPARQNEPELVAEEMSRFLDKLYEANETELGIFLILSKSLCGSTTDEFALLGAQVTRVIVLGRYLNINLTASAPVCAHETSWIAKTLLGDLESLSSAELGKA